MLPTDLPPDLQLIHSDAVISLYYDPVLPGSYVIWHGFATSAAFRAACMRSLELTREKRTYKSISDARNMRVISLADQRWVAEEFLPLAMDLNISAKFYSGTIVPLDFFGRQSLSSITEEIQEALATHHQDVQSITRYFQSYEEAREWLINVDAPEAPTHNLIPEQADEATPHAEAV